MSKVVKVASTDWLKSLDAVPEVPADRAEVMAEAERVPPSGRFPESNRAEGIAGLRELATRLANNPNELGDLAPDGPSCGEVADGIDYLTRSIARHESLTEYLRALRTVREQRGSKMLDEGYEQVIPRVERGRLQADAYGNLRAFVDARGAAVSEGMARAKAARKSQDAIKPPAPAKDEP